SAALAASAVLALAAGEVLARGALAPEDLLHGDAFWIARWNAARSAAEPSLTPGSAVNRWDADLGWVSAEGYRSERVNVNSRGARGLREDPLEKPAGERRIVAIGDSFTFGDGVSDGEAWTARLESELGGVRVINLGGLGYGTDQQYLRLVGSGLDYEPDLVVLGFYGPDVNRNVLSFRDYAKPIFRLDGAGLRLENVPVPHPGDARAVWSAPAPRSWLASLAERRCLELLDQTRFAPKWEVTQRILDRILAASSERGARLLLAYFPNKWWSSRSAEEVVLAAWAREREVAFVDVGEAFAELAPADQARLYEVHWTPLGNEVVARKLAREIERLGLLDGRP
ncbi:MAG TPA: GDSL-type esterase/lipase family protein, partial [Planctomycetota bacterium]|nr:GDSL-type esterase/lipase family protein [Planctomycetota bacterium]